jgi:hypothetical protein
LVLATERALFDMVDTQSKQVSLSSCICVSLQSLFQVAVNPTFRMRAFYHHFIHNPGPKKVVFNFEAKVPLDEGTTWEVRKKPYWKVNRKSVSRVLLFILLLSI